MAKYVNVNVNSRATEPANIPSTTTEKAARLAEPASEAYCFGTNDHPRRDTDVILRQSKALLKLFNSRYVL